MLLDLQREPREGQGLYVGEILDQRSPLQRRDRIVAVNGPSIESLLARPMPGTAQPPVELAYLLDRESEFIELSHRLAARNLLPSLLTNWPGYLFLIYMLAMAVFAYLRRPDLPAARGLLRATSLIFSSDVVFFLGLQPAHLSLWIRELEPKGTQP